MTWRWIVALAVFALACGSTEPADEFKGSYSLATVNGAPLPFRTSVSNVVASLNSGLLIISPKGDFSMATSGTQTVGTGTPSTVAEIINGNWHAAGNTLTLLAYQPPTVIEATYSAGTLTYSEGGRTYVWRR